MRDHSTSGIVSYQQIFGSCALKVTVIQSVFLILNCLTHLFSTVPKKATEFKESQLERTWSFDLHFEKRIEFSVKEYLHRDFAQLRELEGLSDHVMLESIDPNNNLRKLEGRKKDPSGSGEGFLFFTYENSYIIKTISKSELSRFLRMANSYYDLVRNRSMSFISRIYGIYEISFKSQSNIVVIIENIMKSTVDALKFDIKGSEFNRQVSFETFSSLAQIPPAPVYKDIDFHYNISTISLSPRSRSSLLAVLSSDTLLFEQLNIMDYSLLIGIQSPETDKDYETTKKYRFKAKINNMPVFIYIAIIDYFQSYSITKRAERFFKSIAHPRQSSHFSVISPPEYRGRFLQKMEDIFQVLE